MTRLSVWLLYLPLAGILLFAQNSKSSAGKNGSKSAATKEQVDLPEEDETLTPEKEYSFNPIEAARDIDVGNQYFKKKKYRAAAYRYQEATRYNPTMAEAFLRLGEAREKLSDKTAAKEAYNKYLELAPDGKAADEVRKKLGKLGSTSLSRK